MAHEVIAVTFDTRDGYTGYSSRQKQYHYKAPVGLFEAGDKAVVESPSGTSLVTVRRVMAPRDSTFPGNLTKWIVCKVDRSAYERRKELEADIEELKESLSATIEQEQRKAIIEWARQNVPGVHDGLVTLGNLQRELEELGGF